MLSNKEVSSVFKLLSSLMELHGENDFKTKSYSNAAFQLGRVSGHVMAMNLQQLETTQGIGKSVASKIIELQQTGTIQALENLLKITPEGILEILQIKGLGAKKVTVIWKELGVETVGELLYACNENRLIHLKGFGEKTQQSIIQSIEYYQSNLGKFHYATVAVEANALLNLLSRVLTQYSVSLCGDIRRMCNTVDIIEMIVSAGKETADHLQTIHGLQLLEVHEEFITGKSEHDVPFKIYFSHPETFYFDLFTKTGSPDFVNAITENLGGNTHFSSEEELFLTAGKTFLPPELRETSFINQEIETASLLSLSDIKGVVHNHSAWSDGKNSIEEMALACIERGYTYFVISDHSKTAVYAGGLSPEKILEQHAEITSLNEKYVPFKIFKSIESDILNDGSLDYDDELLKQFDLVIASVHSNLKMDEEKATHRLLKAIENPYTTILGHPTGRLLLSRPGYPLNHKNIIDACALHDVLIELNANPYRLDLDHTWIPYALEKGVMISINPDAHSIAGIQDIHWGVISARKGGLKTAMTWNAWSLQQIEDWLLQRRKKKGI